MIHLNQWASRWQIPPQCLAELLQVLGAGDPGRTVGQHEHDGSEAGLQSAIRLEAMRRYGILLMRNNVGACETTEGRMIRYGLANDSAHVNRSFKSSDLIGITPYTVQAHDVGHLLGVFTAFETKRPGWRFRQSDKRAVAQLNFINRIVSLGGFGRFISSLEDL